MFASLSIVLVVSALVEDSVWLVDPRKEFRAEQMVIAIAWLVDP